jgi:hypothetical protein
MKKYTVTYHLKRKLTLAFNFWRKNAIEEKKFHIKYKLAKMAEKEIEKNQKGNSSFKNFKIYFFFHIWKNE